MPPFSWATLFPWTRCRLVPWQGGSTLQGMRFQKGKMEWWLTYSFICSSMGMHGYASLQINYWFCILVLRCIRSIIILFYVIQFALYIYIYIHIYLDTKWIDIEILICGQHNSWNLNGFDSRNEKNIEQDVRFNDVISPSVFLHVRLPPNRIRIEPAWFWMPLHDCELSKSNFAPIVLCSEECL